MCMLTYVPAGITPDVTGILNGATWNTDGHGWAIVGKDRIYQGKGFDAEIVAEQFLAARERHSGAALFHSRWATHGSVTDANIHPFKVGRDRKTILAHNGILPRIAQPYKGDDRSDTRKFAQDIMPAVFGDLDSAEVRDSLTKFIGSNKILVLTANRAYNRRAYLFGEKLGTWQGGVWYSNSDFTKALPVYTPGFGEMSTPGIWDCDLCGTVLPNDADICPGCKACVWCRSAADNCLCYSPPVPSQRLH